MPTAAVVFHSQYHQDLRFETGFFFSFLVALVTRGNLRRKRFSAEDVYTAKGTRSHRKRRPSGRFVHYHQQRTQENLNGVGLGVSPRQLREQKSRTRKSEWISPSRAKREHIKGAGAARISSLPSQTLRRRISRKWRGNKNRKAARKRKRCASRNPQPTPSVPLTWKHRPIKCDDNFPLVSFPYSRRRSFKLLSEENQLLLMAITAPFQKRVVLKSSIKPKNKTKTLCPSQKKKMKAMTRFSGFQTVSLGPRRKTKQNKNIIHLLWVCAKISILPMHYV